MKVVLGSTAGAGGDNGTLLKSYSVREGDEARNSSVACYACSW
jgi:hypothetical protein